MDCCSKEKYQLLEPVLKKFCNKSDLITVLQKSQELYGFVNEPLMLHIAGRLKLKPAAVYGAATFYTQFRFEPAGKYLIQLCRGTACHVNNSSEIEKRLCELLSVKNGQTTSDGFFTLQSVACIGCCSLAPVMTVNDEAYGNLTPDEACRIIDEIKNKEEKNGQC
ncbi:MAG: NAD(P)H-dependent oxidoreductase subunit E [Defluviitaleaceae bacterium]|nr:NAD(P)H-dependent oxidoreductase subunit E [Defluviitaleaceae bacterium]